MIDEKEIACALKIMKDAGLSEFEWQKGDEKIRLVLANSKAMPSMEPVLVKQAPVLAAPVPNNNFKPIKSPFVGTYYASSAPGEDPFVKVGQRIKKGDTLCIVEAMKLMNEIEAEESGTIVEIICKNEDPVEFDQVLFRIE